MSKSKEKERIISYQYADLRFVAAASENTVVYYYCADCGHTLNRCMSGVDKEFLEKYLLEPTNAAYVNRLREYKKQYPKQ